MTRLAGSARAVAAEPRVLLLDEPAAGLDVSETAELARVTRQVADRSGICSLSSPEITGRNAFLVRGGIRVELWAVEGAAPVPAERLTPKTNLLTDGTKQIALDVANLESLVDEMVRQGVDIATVQRSPGKPHLLEEHPETGPAKSKRPAFAAFIRDPNGTLIELYDPSSKRSASA
jgi:catechol 2,3-dioxygenase-like lactoylglutathione lyase family enzyme